MTQPIAQPRRRVDGVLLLDKSPGMTSNQALQKARRLYRAAKGGHTGTLDPLASGLLPICFGEATKFAGGLLEADKAYRASIRLGVRTVTADAEGAVLETRPVAVERAQLDAKLARFDGEIEQIPPMHSALKRAGRPLYEYARRGIQLERQARRVTIHELRVISLRDDLLEIEVACSKGTYVRTLAEDIGEALGCGAHLAALRRMRIGTLTLDAALSLAALEALPEQERDARLAPPDALLFDLPAVSLDAAQSVRFGHGQTLAAPSPAGAGAVRVYCGQRFLGLGRVVQDELVPLRLIAMQGA